MSDPIATAYPPLPPITAASDLPEEPPHNSFAIAAFKPLLNPLQSADPAPASTVVEPPRSPNAANPATDERGINLGVEVLNGPDRGVEPINGSLESAADDRGPLLPSLPASPGIPASAEDSSQPPLPIDAPVPLSPNPKDESPPVLAPGIIPPAVSTPTLIITEEELLKEVKGDQPRANEDPIAGSSSNEPFTPVGHAGFGPASVLQSQPPALSGVAEPLPTPIATPAVDTALVSQSPVVDDSMDVDADGELDPAMARSSPPTMQSSDSMASMKRAGDELDGREEKRIRETVENGASSAMEPPAPPAPPSTSLPWEVYLAPPPRPAGPTSALTTIQLKHFLSTVRALKKHRDSAVFLEPVDVVRFGIPHYHNVIPNPMDLSTVEAKLIMSDPRGPPREKSRPKFYQPNMGTYRNVSDIVADVRQMWENTRKFNGPDHIVTQAADRLDEIFQKALNNIPPEPAPPPPPPVAPAPVPSPAAGPSSAARRASVSQPPVIRRTSEGPDGRPKREIHPPPPKDLAYADGASRKPKRRNDYQLQWALRTIRAIEGGQKNQGMINWFIYPVDQIIAEVPDYVKIIKRPMDLNIIKERLTEGDYEEATEVNSDMRLMFNNAMKYNPPAHEAHEAAQQFLQMWDEKWRAMPVKQEAREESEDPLAGDYVEEASSDEDNEAIRMFEQQISDLQKKVDELRARKRQRKTARTSKPKPKPSKAIARKQSVTKQSPGLNGHAQTKKPRKSKEAVYKEEEDLESEEESGAMTMTKKQELATKIQQADGETLNKAIQIIQASTNLGNSNEEIELDIDSLPNATIIKLYNLVCRGGRSGKPGRPKAADKPMKKTKGRRNMSEAEEAARIAQMEAQLKSLEAPGPGGQQAYTGGDYDSDSSDGESSDEE